MTAKKIKRALKGKKLTFVNVEKVLNKLGYSVVLFNTPTGDIEIERYDLEKQKDTLKAFTYSKTAHIVFVDGALHSDDRLYLLLHELGHIILGHVGDGKLVTRNQILIDIEADNFAHSIIYGNKSTSWMVLVSSIILSGAIIYSTYLINAVQANVSTYTENSLQQPETVSDMVYVTPSGEKFHRKDCFYAKNKELMELSRNEALKRYFPCAVCNP